MLSIASIASIHAPSQTELLMRVHPDDTTLIDLVRVAVRPAATSALTAGALMYGGVALAATIHLYPAQSFEQAVETLAPGDTLIVHAGDYFDSGRISIGVKGTASQPVVVRAADGETRPHIRRPASAAAQNTINIEGATYLTITGLEISSNGGDGINLNSGPAYVTLEDLDIHDVDVGINFRSSMNNITVRRNQIHRTGAPGDGTGEGMYVGCNYAECVVRDSVIENNWIHDTQQSSQGDGIEIKLGSYGNVVRDNVIHDTGYPCVLTYGTNGNPVNVVEGNVMWNCGDSGIQTAADAVIRNNIIFGGTSNGFNSQSHQGAVPANLHFVHNTIVGGQPCVRLSGWGGRPGLVFANNAIYCEGGGFSVGDLTGVTVSGNVINPSTTVFPSGGYVVGDTAATDLTDPVAHDAYPVEGSTVIDAATPGYATSTDFNGIARTGAPDAGAYEWTGPGNPGWRVVPGFKVAGGGMGPEVAFTADPTAVPSGGTSQLSWNSPNATSCSASGGWTGAKGATGNETVGPISASTDFVLSCSGSSGATTIRTVTVAVAGTTEPPSIAISANPNPVALNGYTTLEWTTTGATSCTADAGPWTGAKQVQGAESVGPLSSSTVFTITCTGSGGSTTRSVTVEIVAAPTVQLTANPATVSAGGHSSLSWSSTGAESCSAGGAWAGTKATSSSETTGPLNSTSTFELECTGPGGSTRVSTTVTVQPTSGSPGGTAKSSGGGGPMDPLLTALLMFGLAARNAGSRGRPSP